MIVRGGVVVEDRLVHLPGDVGLDGTAHAFVGTAVGDHPIEEVGSVFEFHVINQRVDFDDAGQLLVFGRHPLVDFARIDGTRDIGFVIEGRSLLQIGTSVGEGIPSTVLVVLQLRHLDVAAVLTVDLHPFDPVDVISLDGPVDHFQSVFFARHRLVVLEELHGLIGHYAEDVVSLHADLVRVVVGNHHHVFRVDLAEHANIASEASQIAPASDVQTVGAFVATVQVNEALVDTDIAADPLSNVARMAVHKVFTALGMPTIFQHFVGDNRTVFCQRQIAPFEEAHQVIDRMLTLVDELGTPGQEVLDRLSRVGPHRMVDQGLDRLHAGNDSLLLGLGLGGRCGDNRHDNLIRADLIGHVHGLPVLGHFFLGHGGAHDRSHGGLSAVFGDGGLVGFGLTAEPALDLVLRHAEELGHAPRLLLERDIDAEVLKINHGDFATNGDRDDVIEKITETVIPLLDDQRVAVF